MVKIWPVPVENPDYYNPYLDKSRHPELHAGYNFDPINGDEVNGAGINEPVWPMWFDSFESLKPMVMTEDLTSIFASECPDLVIDKDPNTIVFAPEVRTLQLRRA